MSMVICPNKDCENGVIHTHDTQCCGNFQIIETQSPYTQQSIYNDWFYLCCGNPNIYTDTCPVCKGEGQLDESEAIIYKLSS